jgi:hypothetical protein
VNVKKDFLAMENINVKKRALKYVYMDDAQIFPIINAYVNLDLLELIVVWIAAVTIIRLAMKLESVTSV